MRPITCLALLAFTLGGCATPNGPHGNWVAPGDLDQERLAADAVQQLAALYPPARTRFELQHPAADPFGQALLQLLRQKGYALREFAPASSRSAPVAAAASSQASADPAAPAVLPLRYVLDPAGDSDLYRLSLWVGQQALTRPYLARNGTVAAGYWLRKE